MYNPSTTETVTLKRKLVIALPGAQQGPVSGFLDAELDPCHALEIDCPDIFNQAPRRKTKFIKGFLVIQSPSPLDVVAVYTAADKCCENVVAFHTERVPAHRVPIPTCDDLDLTLNTGDANWRTVERPLGAINLDIPATEVPSNTKPGVWLDIPESQWVSSGKFAEGRYRFKLCFCLCKGFKDARLSLDIRTDNAGKLSFNGTQIGSTSADSWSKPVTHIDFSDQSIFKAGKNCLEVEVLNTAGPTGFTLAGTLTAKQGKCQD